MKEIIKPKTSKDFWAYWDMINPKDQYQQTQEKRLQNLFYEEPISKIVQVAYFVMNLPEQSWEAACINQIPAFHNHPVERYFKDNFSYAHRQIHKMELDFTFQFAYRIIFEAWYSVPQQNRKEVEVYRDFQYRLDNTIDMGYFRVFQKTKPMELDAQGRVVFTFSTGADITELKHNQNATLVIKKPNEAPVFYKFNTVSRTVFCFGPFSIRQMEILRFLYKGYSSQKIATLLQISPHTVDTHKRNMLEMTNCVNTTALLVYASLLGIL
jgi:DNA-binding CsgD family transcriptional regulator